MIAGTEEEGVETPEEAEFYHRMMDASSQQLREMKDKYKGEDCFLIGLGPSLNKTDLNLINGKRIFGANSLYLFADTLNLNPQFYGLSDGRFFDLYGDDVLRIDSQLFLTRYLEIQYLRRYEYYSKIVKREPILVWSLLPEMPVSKRFSKDMSEGIYGGWSVIIDLGLQLAYHLGFQRAILIGCDCSRDPETGGHFYDRQEFVNLIPTCVRTGIETGPSWQPNTKQMIPSYQVCKQAWEEDGREIINATVGGSLEVFKRMMLEDCI